MAKYRKKLIEVALPLDAINKASAREKSIRHGHPSTLHLWWARRPLAACRAVLFSSLVDDPDDDPMFAGNEDLAATKRAKLFDLIEELVEWKNSNNPRVINKARAEIARCVATQKIEDGEFETADVVTVPRLIPEWKRGQTDEPDTIDVSIFDIRQILAQPEQVNAFLAEHAPPVLDPFAGGASIPLEAQRLGLRAHASDLNPVAVLINKALIEIPPKFAGMPPVNPEARKGKLQNATWQGAQGLAEDVRYYGQWMRDEAERRIGHLYPKIKVTDDMVAERPDLEPYRGQKLTVTAWLWTRTVPSPNPAANGSRVPLVRSFWLSKKKGKEAYVQPIVDKQKNTYEFRVKTGDPKDGFDPGEAGTVSRTGATCILTDGPITLDHIRDAGQKHQLGMTILAIVVEGNRNKLYLSSDCQHEITSCSVTPKDYPDMALPEKALGFRVQRYGMTRTSHLFTARQLSALALFFELARSAYDKVCEDTPTCSKEYAAAITTYLACSCSRFADYWSSLNSWQPANQQLSHTFSRQSLSMVWDFVEANPFSGKGGSFDNLFKWTVQSLPILTVSPPGQALQADAPVLPSFNCSALVSTDPPYYDNIGYADLSDFFYVWLRRSLVDLYPHLFATLLTPKSEELIATPFRHNNDRSKARIFFEDGLRKSLEQMKTVGCGSHPMTIYYAFKQVEAEWQDANSVASTGWETMLAGLINSGFEITATWPLRTEMTHRMRGIGSNALAASIVLACRPRTDWAGSITRREFVMALHRELPQAIRSMQWGHVAPVDLAQASIGPGMAVFSRYSKVLNADGSSMTVREALQLINQELDEALTQQEGEFDSDTRWAIAWFEQFGTSEGPYGVAETLSTAKNVSVEGLQEAGILVARGGKVRLLSRDEYPDDWDPSSDTRTPVWEAMQHLVRTLERDGEAGAAALLSKLQLDAEVIRDLAYRLYTTCERKKWAKEAISYNALVVSWSAITQLARETSPKDQQSELF